MRYLFGYILLVALIFSKEFTLGIPDIAKDSEELIIAQERIKSTFANLGHKVNFVYLPTIRASENANNGSIDGVFPKIGTDISDFKNLFLVEEPISKNSISYSIYYLKGVFEPNNWKNLENKKIAIFFGNNLSKTLIEKNLKNYEILEGKSLFAMYNFLETGRADYVLLIDTYGDELLSNYKNKNIKKSQNPIYNSSAYLIMNKNYYNLKEDLEKELKKVKVGK